MIREDTWGNRGIDDAVVLVIGPLSIGFEQNGCHLVQNHVLIFKWILKLNFLFFSQIWASDDQDVSSVLEDFTKGIRTWSPIHKTCLSLSVSMVLKLKLKYMLRTT